MKKLQSKLTLARETLCRLDAVAGGQIGGLLPPTTTANPTDCTLCYRCDDTVHPRGCAQQTIANPIANPGDTVFIAPIRE